MQETRYGLQVTIPVPYETAVQRATDALKGEGFGVLTTIDVKETLRAKLNREFRKYVILGACNPPLAYKTVQEDINIGLLLPCNVIVYEADDPANSVVAVIDAERMMSVVGESADLKTVAADVNEKLRRAIDAV